MNNEEAVVELEDLFRIRIAGVWFGLRAKQMYTWPVYSYFPTKDGMYDLFFDNDNDRVVIHPE